MPWLLLRAMVVLALAWRWADVAAMLALGFAALLRPGELRGLKRQNLVFAEELGQRGFFLAQIPKPKMR
eukprot:14988347-Alexandrium_andersonii.AAC.1